MMPHVLLSSLGADQMIRGGAMAFFGKKGSAKTDEKIVSSANCEKLTVGSQNWQKTGVI